MDVKLREVIHLDEKTLLAEKEKLELQILELERENKLLEKELDLKKECSLSIKKEYSRAIDFRRKHLSIIKGDSSFLIEEFRNEAELNRAQINEILKNMPNVFQETVEKQEKEMIDFYNYKIDSLFDEFEKKYKKKVSELTK